MFRPAESYHFSYDNMKILHFIYDHIDNPWVGGGGAVRAYEIYRRLSDRHDITIISGRYPGAADYREGNLSYRFVGTGKNNYMLSTFRYAARAARFLHGEVKPGDVIVEDFAPWNPVFSFRYKTRASVLLQIQSRLGVGIIRKYPIAGLPFFLVERFYPNAFENFIFVSPSVRGKCRGSSAVISNGIDEGLLNLQCCEDGYIAFLGRIDIHTKGLDTLVKAMHSLEVPLKVGGDGKDRSAFVAMIKGKSNVRWLGALTGRSKTAFLEGMEFLVLPSRFEGQGIVVLEAAACGKPVIVSDVPGLRYAVDAGFGVSFKTGDAKDLKDKIEFLRADPSLRREMGRKAREYAIKFTWDRIAEQYEDFILSVSQRKQEKGA